MADKKITKKAAEPREPSTAAPIDEGCAPDPSTREGDAWFSGISSGVQATARKLLDQVPPEVRKNLMEHARQHGPQAAVVAVDAAARKVRGPRAKLALRALSGLLRMFVSTNPKP